jgi:hypothetical protein
MPKKKTRGDHASSGKKIRYAVVGLGHISQVAVLPAFKNARNSELFALVSSDPQKQKKVARQYGIDNVFSYEQYDQALELVMPCTSPCPIICIVSTQFGLRRRESMFFVKSRWR